MRCVVGALLVASAAAAYCEGVSHEATGLHVPCVWACGWGGWNGKGPGMWEMGSGGDLHQQYLY